MNRSSSPHILIVEARFYDSISDQLLSGAAAALREAGVTFETLAVPGALEIPPAIRIASESKKYDGYVALGCVLRGETYHFEVVANESARGITDLGVHYGLCVGNGILTCETGAQAVTRADIKGENKGAAAALAALSLIAIRSRA
jgi:6,7-dimethyl-8-ribityllumazine synthase